MMKVIFEDRSIHDYDDMTHLDVASDIYLEDKIDISKPLCLVVNLIDDDIHEYKPICSVASIYEANFIMNFLRFFNKQRVEENIEERLIYSDEKIIQEEEIIVDILEIKKEYILSLEKVAGLKPIEGDVSLIRKKLKHDLKITEQLTIEELVKDL